MAQPLAAAWSTYLIAARREFVTLRQTEPSLFPHYTEEGRWRNLSASSGSAWTRDQYDHGNWTAGFSLGVMWLLWLAERDESVVSLCRLRLAELIARADDASTHDLGFLFFPSFALGHVIGVLSRDEVGPAMRAADMLVRRFNPRGRYLQAFGPIGDARLAETSTIDTMMNLPLLWWAIGESGDPWMAQTAREHARTVARLFFRPDGSSYHLVRFDPLSGALSGRGTYQGFSNESCWSRGQAWAVCGFAWAYAATSEPEFLMVSERSARYYLDHLPTSGIPPWDFADSDESAPLDASASAICALGLLILAEVHPEARCRAEFLEASEGLLLRLDSTCANRQTDVQGILLESCYSRPHNLGLRGAVAWGDFYYGLALAVANGLISLRALLPQLRASGNGE
jgi:unsaturated chondroitin disaccharide hydrolase